MSNDLNNQNNVQNMEENVEVNSADMEAVVIGELRTDKIGKPILVVILLVIFLIVMIAFPFVNQILDSDSNIFTNLFGGKTNNNSNSNNPIPANNGFLDANNLQTLNSSTSMKFENLLLQKFSLNKNNITMTLSSYNGILNLDNKEYYLELYSASENLIGHVKLMGVYDNALKEITFTSNHFSFNSNLAYKGKVVDMKDKEYPEYTLTTDESGIGSLTCKKANRSIDYVFKNGSLISIKDTVKVNLADQKNADEYLDLKKIYDEKANTMKKFAINEENAEGFVFSANINLEGNKVPESVKDYDYFLLNTNVKRIHYEEIGKGFDCQ